MQGFKVVILIYETPLSQERFDAMLSLASNTKRKRIKRFKTYSDACKCLFGEFLARIELGARTNTAAAELEFSFNMYGKPYLSGHPDVHFNISHSGRYIALAIDDEPVGIDIEQPGIRQLKSIDRIAKRFFAPDEIAYILNATEATRAERFFEIWTKKESRIKWEGIGMSKLLPSFSVLDTDITGNREPVQLYYHRIAVDDEAVCHVCSTKREEPVVTIMNTDEL